MLSLKQYIPSFAGLIKDIDVNSITSNEYAGTYLNEIITHRNYYLSIYALTLEKAFSKISKNPGDTILVDFGCGTGLLGLFAKHCGVKNVYALDSGSEFLLTAEKLSLVLNIKLDGFIAGEEDILPGYFSDKQPPDIIVGTDVIEHIYDLKNLFKIFRDLNPSIITAFTTASVAENPIQSGKLKKFQQRNELIDSDATQSDSDNKYAGLPYIEIRRRLILEQYPALKEDKVNLLAKLTRGLHKQDIYKAVDSFITTNILPVELMHPTNTCDPITASCTERLLTIQEYKKIYKEAGFYLTVYNGFYNGFESGIKSKLLAVINTFISLIGNKAKIISPFILLTGNTTND